MSKDQETKETKDLAGHVASAAAAVPALPAVSPPPAGAATQAAVAQSPSPAFNPPADQKAIQEATARERQRICAIQATGQVMHVDAAIVEKAIEDGTSIDAFKVEVVDQFQKGNGPLSPVHATESSRDKFQAAAVEAIVRRAGVAFAQPPSQAVRDLGHASLMELAGESFRLGGQRPIGDREHIARAALGDQEAIRLLGLNWPYQTPGDFPNVLSAAAGKILEAAPPFMGTTFQNWAFRLPDLADFKPSTIIRVGEMAEFPLHVDADDFEATQSAEDYAWIAVDSYGAEFGLTPKMMVDDDLGAFALVIQDFRAAADMTVNRLCVNLLTGNATGPDGIALFHAVSHGNDIAAGSGGVPSTAQLSAIRVLLRAQTGVGGHRNLNYTVARVLVPEALETTTQQLLSATLGILAVTEASTPLFKGQVDYDVEPMLTAHSAAEWFSFADPRRARSIVYAYQRGFAPVQLDDYYRNENKCRIYRGETRAAAAINNYRGVVRNAGA